ncbi:MAG: hypothetical protein IJ313_06550 [Clostridia bacterium]|nr:hypothetical protein [Clostridia bacterium]
MMNLPDSDLLLGVDVGTTTLSLTVVNVQTCAVVYRLTLLNDSRLPDSKDQSLQDAGRIAELALDAVASLLDGFPGIAAIGVTGQMHGVVLLDDMGEAVSPLYTWQNQLADSDLCGEIQAKTGRKIYPGYGHATLYALARSGSLPPHARAYCTIMDYIVMRLTGRKAPLMHSTNAASLGLWDITAGCFDEAALSALALSPLRAPMTVSSVRTAGFHHGVPVCVAVEDNQASFFGSVQDETHSLLLNYGTGSQLSLVCSSPDIPGGEIRPYFNAQYLLCRSALCGGRAYAMLERFFAAFASQAGCPGESQYETLNALAEQAYRSGQKLSVSTRFCGTRDDPSLRGSISGIGEASFTPGALALGVLQGMVDELHEGFDPAAHPQLRRLVASGNAVRRNPMLRRLLSDTFSMPLLLTAQQEEAALGAALLGGIAAGILSYQQAKSMIRLELG